MTLRRRGPISHRKRNEGFLNSKKHWKAIIQDSAMAKRSRTLMIRAVLTIVGIFSSLVVIDYYIEYKITNVIQSEGFQRNLQERLRPAMIFDQNGSIFLDKGGWKWIDDLKVLKNKRGFVEKITFTLKNPNMFPILTSLDNTVNYSINIARGKGSEVIYELEMNNYSEPRATPSYFSLEMVEGAEIQSIAKPPYREKVMYIPGKIIADSLDTVRKPGNTKLNVGMNIDPVYQPDEGDTYYDTRVHSYFVFSEGKWKKLAFATQEEIREADASIQTDPKSSISREKRPAPKKRPK